MNELIGKKFKRYRYGLSTWTDVITEVGFRYEYLYVVKKQSGMSFIDYIKECMKNHTLGHKVKPYVKSKNGMSYDLDEIIVYNEPNTNRDTGKNNQQDS